MPTTVVLMSGGLDSTVVLALARTRGHSIIGMSFDYGQRHKKEILFAETQARAWGVETHLVTTIRLPVVSALTADQELPVGRTDVEMQQGVPSTYVPGRNMIFLACAFSTAESHGASAVAYGANAIDYSGYPDCRPEFVLAFERAAHTGMVAKVHLDAPLLGKSKAEIIQLGSDLGVDFSSTWSCYAGLEHPCRRCDSCLLRQRGFDECGLRDPAGQ